MEWKAGLMYSIIHSRHMECYRREYFLAQVNRRILGVVQLPSLRQRQVAY